MNNYKCFTTILRLLLPNKEAEALIEMLKPFFFQFTPEAILPAPVYCRSTHRESLVTHPFWLRFATIEASTSGSSVFISCTPTCIFLAESALLKRSPPAYYFASSFEWFTNAVRQRQWEGPLSSLLYLRRLPKLGRNVSTSTASLYCASVPAEEMLPEPLNLSCTFVRCSAEVPAEGT